jgi:sarcosine/dimethylglycine N-methyltransferase
MLPAHASATEIARKNSEMYDDTASPVWYMAVYEPIHDGWEFINLGGKDVLDRMAAEAGLAPGTRAIEFCSGQGATCRYLATRYDCAVTGIERNAGQIANAIRRLRQVDAAVADRVRFVHANVLDFQPDRQYDCCYSVDSMMLIENVPAALSTAYRALRPGGCLMFATIAAGRRIDSATRSFAWEADGMITLGAPSEYCEWMEAAGFRGVAAEDITSLAVNRSIEIDAAVERNCEAIVSAGGEEAYRGWRDIGGAYLRAFQTGRLSYLLVTGRKAGQGAESDYA